MFYKTPHGSHYHATEGCPAIAGHTTEPCDNTAGLEPCALCVRTSVYPNTGANGTVSSSSIGDTDAQAHLADMSQAKYKETTEDSSHSTVLRDNKTSESDIDAQTIVQQSEQIAAAGRSFRSQTMPRIKATIEKIHKRWVLLCTKLWFKAVSPERTNYNLPEPGPGYWRF